ncbi:hypothetical protein EJ08DRAFT_267684 [Tothia fuscella]|uniref:Uncharacterized protein n=1 Tax=Tothia fuscella TaxID=1048955 RepID=A0A9P4NQF5_9PEZI|nr:hypothetical protein EJ08DRAFT_267684 [Tothia fuscella]
MADLATRTQQRDFRYIQHLYIDLDLVDTMVPWCSESEQTTFFNRLFDLVRLILHRGNRIKTLQVLYRNGFNGQLDMLLNSPNKATREEGPEILRLSSPGGKGAFLRRDHLGNIELSPLEHTGFFPLPWCRVLDPLLALQGVVEDVQIRGDLPPGYVKEMQEKMMHAASISAAVKKIQKERERLAELRKGHADSKETFVELMERLGEKNYEKPAGWIEYVEDQIDAPMPGLDPGNDAAFAAGVSPMFGFAPVIPGIASGVLPIAVAGGVLPMGPAGGILPIGAFAQGMNGAAVPLPPGFNPQGFNNFMNHAAHGFMNTMMAPMNGAGGNLGGVGSVQAQDDVEEDDSDEENSEEEDSDEMWDRSSDEDRKEARTTRRVKRVRKMTTEDCLAPLLPSETRALHIRFGGSHYRRLGTPKFT